MIALLLFLSAPARADQVLDQVMKAAGQTRAPVVEVTDDVLKVDGKSVGWFPGLAADIEQADRISPTVIRRLARELEKARSRCANK